MDKELFRKTEGRLYRYFKSKKLIYNLNKEISDLENKKQNIEYDIRNSNVDIDYYQNGIGISERVQTSSTGTSYAESEMCRAIEKLEKEHLDTAKKILKNKAKIRELEAFIKHMERNIEMLQEEDKRFIELQYGDKASIPIIMMKINIARATYYRKREELVKNISQFMYLIK